MRPMRRPPPFSLQASYSKQPRAHEHTRPSSFRQPAERELRNRVAGASWRSRLVFLAIWLLTSLILAPGHAAATNKRCFAETRLCIEGRFLEYWEQNGGLPVFGLPLTGTHMAVNADTGQSYLTQWFERNRFELHPKNDRPYDVLLGRLGADELRLGLAPNVYELRHMPPPEQRQPEAGCLWFPETRFNLCDEESINGGPREIGFKSYWQSLGLSDESMSSYQRSLALFGLPISSMFYAYNTSGDYVIMQYFERARLEFHYREGAIKPLVLQGRLGAEIKYPIVDWQIVRDVVAGRAPVYQPGWLPERYGRPEIFDLGANGQHGCELACYTLGYQGHYQEDQLAFILNVGYQGWDDDTLPLEQHSVEELTIHGIKGTLISGWRWYGDVRVRVFIARWQEHGQLYRVKADSNQLTRVELLKILDGLRLEQQEN